jgi:ABC-type nitrate/sulfonate/bicarbonate transport system substrate-binding protein
MFRRSLLIQGAIAAALWPAFGRPAAAEDRDELSELRYQGWSGRVLYPELAQDLGYLTPLSLKWVGNTYSGPQDIQAAVTGDTDFGAAFIGSIEKLMAAGAPIKAAIGSTGSDKESWPGLYVLVGNTIKAPRDLLGKKIGVNTLGAHYEFMINEYLKRGGLAPGEIKQVTLVAIPQASAEQTLRLKQVDAAVLADVFREKAVAAGGLELLLSDYELFGTFTSGAYVMTTRFIARNPNAARKFVEATAHAIDWVQTHSRDEVIARFQDIIRKARARRRCRHCGLLEITRSRRAWRTADRPELHFIH